MDAFKITNPKFAWQITTTDSQHPHLELLENFKYQEDQLRETPLPTVEEFLDSNVQIVDDKVLLIKLLQVLRKQKEIGIDVYDRRGKKPLKVMSISTITTDFILDLVQIREHMGLLSEIFLNPQIVKILAVQRHLHLFSEDMCLYFINVIDLDRLYHALSNKHHFFAYIRDRFKINRAQCGDINYSNRPMSKGTIHHCRASVHHFIHIYNDFKNQLLAIDLQLWIKMLDTFRDLCKVLADEKETNHLNIAMVGLQEEHEIQLEFLRKLFEWRHSIAEAENIEPDSVASPNTLLKLTSINRYTKTYFGLTTTSYISRDFEQLCALYKQIKYKVIFAKKEARKLNC